MIEEITSIGFEVVDIKRPTTVGNGYPKLILFVALSVKLGEPATVSAAKIK